ncbi:CDP-diacylglycerol--glycerol-3-phosphate 3-phosphatidyltransferase [Chitinimonas taiwanensis]|jgi:CDP-diacylglycerol--glycerol-3-phosphate 3-phosphatidyltransferase/cardiolipin synthase|uniref:CDP-diacylglycerol--glycerol-3-phosphate 3-phosphatidyltransferase n=1 Tax=Chitinimonas taiwanensis DSM 18899 TaxID=1121279 RepID=A0A1K2HMG8_9NEIS|nr:CDP-diacylglycerol--glycerol-3-phosphate 3-phosphatidyltransferase [Chitinimonas taiwanensis]SFZ77450.1 CDP-diacylglycerol--glycerol-3-phosphate 3-phosphatidyltransferase [Chitinimonas taiwanensis DSM 18899]
MPLNLPNLLTWARILMIPLILGVYYFPDSWMTPAHKNIAGALLFMLAGITDWFDGYLARKWNQLSAFGAFLDPVADKLMVAAALILLVQLGRADAWLAAIIIGREITISALREWMAQLGNSKSVAVSFVGKVKTAAQMTAITMLLLHENLIPGIDLQQIGSLCLFVAALLTLWSMGYYLRMAWPQLSGRESR